MNCMILDVQLDESNKFKSNIVHQQKILFPQGESESVLFHRKKIQICLWQFYPKFVTILSPKDIVNVNFMFPKRLQKYTKSAT